ncbi:hypothetical protein CFP71_01395 [Amycolatopsis thailandensis]|uniref:Uncharacterized protein n=1 Tax=Amycolatopsis thailandensis TaxID=589330 RepID=A0A229SIH3_9PSEU|nr:hypothetical protein [Amycolatopsis thailandensis]OXM58697.1 hypothetical protein CFP71_01395 [Amycolatopsis thailandensis]
MALNEPRHFLVLGAIVAGLLLLIGGVRWTMTEPARQRQEQEQSRQIEHQQNVDRLRQADCIDHPGRC